MTHLDLFSGIGGFAIAAQRCGYTTVGFCEKEPYAQQILKERFGAVLADAKSHGEHGEHGNTGRQRSTRHKSEPQLTSRSPRLHDDIFTLNGADYFGVDLLTGGFPCQPFSFAGKRRGAADDRALWPQMLRVIDESKPTWLIGENVAGIVTMELDNILSDLEAIGYAAWPLVIPACAVDARHRRDRVWILGADTRRDQCSKSKRKHERTEISGGSSSNELESWKDVADANEPRPQGRNGAELRERGGERTAGEGGSFCFWPDESKWFAESGMGRVAHGIPNRAHRLRGLGNAIVPQVAEEIIRAITLTL